MSTLTSHPLTTRTVPTASALAAALLVGLAACDGGPTEPPSSALGQNVPSLKNDATDGAALLVGNFSPGGAANGILRYAAADGDFVDEMVPVGTDGLTIGCCMTFGPDEHLYVGSPFTAEVLRFNGVTGEFVDAFVTSGSGGLIVPLVPVFGPDGNLYVGDLGVQQILQYDGSTGAFIDVFVAPGSAGMGGGDPQVFTFGPDGNLYVASQATDRVLRFDGSTGAFIDVFVPAGSGGLDLPVGVAFGPGGDLYVASATESENEGSILRYDGNTGAFVEAFVPTGSGGISGPRVIEFKSDITVCHRSSGNPSHERTLTIGYLSGIDHIAHGDEIGACS